jgi:hypothetical protein
MHKEDEAALMIFTWLFLFLTGYFLVIAWKDGDVLRLAYAGISAIIFWLCYRKL